jgi:hypothetical protein
MKLMSPAIQVPEHGQLLAEPHGRRHQDWQHQRDHPRQTQQGATRGPALQRVRQAPERQRRRDGRGDDEVEQRIDARADAAQHEDAPEPRAQSVEGQQSHLGAAMLGGEQQQADAKQGQHRQQELRRFPGEGAERVGARCAQHADKEIHED